MSDPANFKLQIKQKDAKLKCSENFRTLCRDFTIL